MMKKLLILTIAVGFILGSFVGASAKSTLEIIKERGKLIAGVRYDSPPFGYIDKNNQVVGFDVEIVKAIAKKLNVDLEMKQVTAKTRIPMLLNGSVDMFAAICTHTTKRDEVIDYSMTYYITGQRILVKKGSGIKSYCDLAGKTVAGVQGTVSIPNFLKVQPKAKILTFQEYPQCLMAVLQGKASAMTTDAVVLYSLAKKNPQVEVVGEFFTREPYGLGVRENDSDWRDFINFTILDLWKSGEFNELHEKIFGQGVDFQIDVWQ